jgi:hypothetical protein
LTTFWIGTAMRISPFFLDLQSVYHAELDDLRSDSEGVDVLRHRLADKRKALGFLLQMMETSPEMVAVVLHQAFTFSKPAVLDRLVSQDDDELPQWEQIEGALTIAPWAHSTVAQILREPLGPWFMVVAAGLEYLYHRAPSAPSHSAADDADDDSAGDEDNREHNDNDRGDDRDGADDDEANDRAREDAGNDWLAEQGFDRKDPT